MYTNNAIKNRLKLFEKDCSNSTLPFKFNKQNISLQSDSENKKIANCFINPINLIKQYVSNSKTNYFAECYILCRCKNEDDMYNQVGHSGSPYTPLLVPITYNQKTQSFSFKDKFLMQLFKETAVKIYDQPSFTKIVNMYLNWSLNDLEYDNISGWNKNTYVGITSPELHSPTIPRRLFNNIFKDAHTNHMHVKYNYEPPDLNLTSNFYIGPAGTYRKKESLSHIVHLNNILTANHKLLIAFIYSIIAISKNFFNQQNCDKRAKKLFKNHSALCICGTNKHITPYATANIISNMLDVSPKNINKILYYSDNINLSKANVELRKFTNYNDLTLLVYSQNRELSPRNRYVKSIIKNFMSRNIQYCPVFISKKPWNIQECFDLDISDYTPAENGISLSSAKEINDLKGYINGIYIAFIKYISPKHEQTEYADYLSQIAKKCRIKKVIPVELYQSSDNATTFYCQLLMFTYIFKEFLDTHNLHHVGDNLISIMQSLKPYFYDDKQPAADTKSPEDCFKAYIKSIFVDKTYTPPYKYFEGMDRGDGKGYCYYLEGSKYFDDFAKKYNLSITNFKFNRILRQLGLIKTKSDNSSVVMSRSNNGEQGNYLVVLKEKVEN